MKFQYESKGSADDWTKDTIEAENAEEAQSKLDTIYGITRDKSGKQTNSEVVQVRIIESTAG